MTPRRLAHGLLMRLERNEQFSNIILDRALLESDMSEADRSLATALLYGVTEKRITLDYVAEGLSSRPLDSIDKNVLSAIRLGLYQLIFMDKIPPHAAINESVELVPRSARGFVNAILRAYTRTERLIYPDKEKDIIHYLSVKYSVLPELAERLYSVFGEETEHLLCGFEKNTGTTISVNTLKTDVKTLGERLNATPTRYSYRGLKIKGSVRASYGFEEGLFFVQDEASQICVETLGAKPNERILDICACPGSKSFGAAIAMENKGEILAFDLHKKKLPLIVSGAERLGITIIKTEEHDGRDFIPSLLESADRIICDVPCSGFGVLAKKPELRYKAPQTSKALPDIQLAILENCCKYLKRGGTLVYSTCTVLPEENEKNIDRFLALHKNFTLSPFKVGELDVPNGYITLLPHIHGTDGFFIARLTRA